MITSLGIPTESNKYLIIYHANCLDGITAAAVTHKFLTEAADVDATDIYSRATNYGDSIEELVAWIKDFNITSVYIVDFSFNLEELEAIDHSVKQVTLLDHHASAFRNLCGEDYVVEPNSKEDFNLFANVLVCLDNDESGASLCYREFFGQKLPHLVGYVKDYDLYRFKHGYTKAINKYLKLQRKSISVFLILLEEFEDDNFLNRAYKIGQSLVEQEEHLEDSLISDGLTPVCINGVSGLVVNAPPTLASSIGNKLADKSKTFGATWWQAAGGVVQWSLRSIEDNCDVSKLAESMGGGGHKNAAGFKMEVPAYDEEKGITIWEMEDTDNSLDMTQIGDDNEH